MKKTLVLIFAFLLPVLGVVIFKFYSESHFDVQVYHRASVPQNLNCAGIKAPYRIDSAKNFRDKGDIQIQPFLAPNFKIFAFSFNGDLLQTEMNRIGDAFYEENAVDVFWVKDSVVIDESAIPAATNIRAVRESRETMDQLRECVFLFQEENDNAVLVDEINRIRGYYNLAKSEEVDSLIIETKILLREKELSENVHPE